VPNDICRSSVWKPLSKVRTQLAQLLACWRRSPPMWQASEVWCQKVVQVGIRRLRGRRAEKEEADMRAILLAVFDDHSVAERVRVSLVRDGFPTDRVELTASCEPGRASLGPADSPHDKFVQYFGVLFTREDQRHYAEQLAGSAGRN